MAQITKSLVGNSCIDHVHSSFDQRHFLFMVFILHWSPIETSRRSLIIWWTKLLCVNDENQSLTLSLSIFMERCTRSGIMSAWNVQPFPNQGPFTSWTSRRSLIISRTTKWGLLISVSDHLFFNWCGLYLPSEVNSISEAFSFGCCHISQLCSVRLTSRKYWWCTRHCVP